MALYKNMVVRIGIEGVVMLFVRIFVSVLYEYLY
jgi:hypothetical protein